MNLKKAEKIWRDSQPLEANGLVSKRRKKFLDNILKRSENRKRFIQRRKEQEEANENLHN